MKATEVLGTIVAAVGAVGMAVGWKSMGVDGIGDGPLAMLFKPSLIVTCVGMLFFAIGRMTGGADQARAAKPKPPKGWTGSKSLNYDPDKL